MTEYPQHLKAKHRIYDIVSRYNPDILEFEYLYHNPKNESNDRRWEWYFDVFFKLNEREYAIEIDGKKGHRSRKKNFQSKENVAKRKFKVEYLKTKNIYLFAWPTEWLVGRGALPDSVFIDELHLPTNTTKQWYNT